MDNNMNMKNGQINNGQKTTPATASNKSIWKDQSFRKGFLTGAGSTAGAAVLYFVGKLGYTKVKSLIQARRAKRAQAAAEPEPKK